MAWSWPLVLMATAGAGIVSWFLTGFARGLREGWREEARAANRRRMLHARLPPKTTESPPGVIIEHTGCDHENAKTLQRDVSLRCMSETKWCRDCGALYEHATVGSFRHEPRWTQPRKPEQK